LKQLKNIASVKPVIISFILFSFVSTAFSYCFEEAGAKYEINPLVLWSIAKAESNFNPYAIGYNPRSYDFGVMQINSGWYGTLGRDLWMSLDDPCTNVMVGAWILRQCIDKYGYTWDAVGCYNAGSKNKRSVYAWKIYGILKDVKEGKIR